jgi:endonuclease/exonuclease/phosphatase family metal-dependent hydrolase
VDYVFAYGIEKTALIDAWIEKDRLAKYASDHFPIGLEVR